MADKILPSFLWGAATSAHQVEGNNIHSDWWDWEAQGNIEGGARSGAATDHWNRFREDIRLAADLGINSYRFSIEWARVEPEPGQWNMEALEWYRELIHECEKHHIVPMATLHHFTSPQWFAKQGGFAANQAAEAFLKYATKVYQHLGPHVPLWCTFNEPMVLIIGGYLGKFMPPAVFSPDSAAAVTHQIWKAHTLCYDFIHSHTHHRSGKWKDIPTAVGIAHNMIDLLPDRPLHPVDHLLAFLIRRFYNQSWLKALTGKNPGFGIPGIFPKVSPVTEALGRRTADFMGVNYYTKAYVRWKPRGSSSQNLDEIQLGFAFARAQESQSDLGWAIHPKGFKKILREVSRYGLPIYITENGIADKKDRLRPRYLLDHLKVIAELIESGVDILGYYHWSLLDNFEWKMGFGPRFGLFRVNYENFERTATGTAELYRKVIQIHAAEKPESTQIKAQLQTLMSE